MDNSQNLQFSKFRHDELEQLCQLLSSVFNTSFEELAGLYQGIASNFDDEGWPPPHFTSRSFFQSKDLDFQKIYEKSPSVAVDLPSLLELNNGNPDKPTIVVIGQDPKSDQSHDDISVGTPYGLHHKGSRTILAKTKLYFDMIDVLMRMGYRVYLTDVFKIWVCDPQRPYCGIDLPDIDKNRFLEILQSEIAIVEPAAIITWGKPSENVTRNMKADLRLSFPHPSGAANGAWKKLIGQSPTRASKLAYWQSAMTQALEANSAIQVGEIV
jgi:hypothetical protein